MNIDTALLSRVTLVDEGGRVYERFNLKVELSVQDNGQTLKIFVKSKSEGLEYCSKCKREIQPHRRCIC